MSDKASQTVSFSGQPWSLGADKVLDELGVTVEEGLDSRAVTDRRSRYGANRLRRVERVSVWTILLDQLKSVVVLLLAAAMVLSFMLGEWPDGLAIFVVILVNTAIGFFMEIKAVRSMEALRQLEQVTAKVRRNGGVEEISADELVPGDVIILEGGDVVSADLRVVEASKLQADESVLTGESMPVGKGVDAAASDAPLAERTGMLYKGTAVTRGSGVGVVVATGMATELGQISSLVEQAEEETTPLEKRLDQMGRKLLWVVLVIMVIIAGVGIVRGKDMLLMIETAVALAVAAIPEGLPVVATIALARGMLRMARRNALVNRLSAVETLGGTRVICTDKTGTLTENEMTVVELVSSSGPIAMDGVSVEDNAVVKAALEIGVLCNNASIGEGEDSSGKAVGDPMETALLRAGVEAGIRRDALIETLPEEREEAFDSDVKMMGTFHRTDGGYRVAVKGAPEAVIDVSSRVLTADGAEELTDESRRQWLERNAAMAERGLRVLAVAEKSVGDLEAGPYEALTLVALVGLSDPPREDVAEAIGLCGKAGIDVVMVTGDQAVTARSIARAVGLAGADAEVIHGRDIRPPEELSEADRHRFRKASIFARVSPKQKLDLIALHQQAGNVVAMTGDGVNDAPALKKADIGVAMGQRGTQVAREAADMVLKDDAFSTIVAAVEQGRVIFNNIRKFVVYLLSCNVSEVMIVFLTSLVNAPLPILPLQILFLNLVTDVFPALVLGVGEGDRTIMDRRPRPPGESILLGRHWGAITAYGALITFAVLTAFALAFAVLGMETQEAVTVSFLTLAFAQLWHIFNMRDRGTGVFSNEVTRNRFVWGALGLCVVLLLLVLYVPVFAEVMQITPPGGAGWVLVVGMSLVPLVVGQVVKQVASPGAARE